MLLEVILKSKFKCNVYIIFCVMYLYIIMSISRNIGKISNIFASWLELLIRAMNANEGVLPIILPLVLSAFAILWRLFMVLPCINGNRTNVDRKDRSLKELQGNIEGKRIMIFLGSGGHTAEMMRILEGANLSNLERTWVASSGDSSSLLKCKKYEEESHSLSKYKANYVTIDRARSVGQSSLLSITSTAKSTISIIEALYPFTKLPSVLLLDGPGTCVPLAYVVILLKFLGFCKTKIIYIESLARVAQLSWSGKLTLPIADRFIVQWEQLSYKHKRAEYYGILI